MRSLRFIPAGAGNTVYARDAHTALTVHPRGRGEHPATPKSGCGCHGSSPRARGTPYYGVELEDVERFIPAGAGNTESNVEVNHG